MTRPWPLLTASTAAAFLLLGACLRPAQPPLLLAHVPPRPALPLLRTAPAPANPAPAPSQSPRQQVLEAARAYLGGAPLRAGGYDFPPDPVGFVRAAYWQAGVDLFTQDAAEAGGDGLSILYRSADVRGDLHRDPPEPGDLVFLGREPGQSGSLGAVAIVERVDRDGTITAIGSFHGGPRRVKLNLRQPEREVGEDGGRINDALAEAPSGQGSTPAGRLFRSFAAPLR